MPSAFLPFLCLFFLCFAPTSVYTQCNPTAAEIPNNGTDEDCDGLDDIFLFLPPYIYMVEGQDFEVYFRNLILSKHPQDYVFSVNTSLNGLNSGQKWAFTPTATNVGEFPLSVTVKSNSGQMLASATSTVRISPATAPADLSPKRLILFGHSFFDQGYLPKYLYDRTHQPANPPITFHGKKMSWANAQARHEGYGGRQARWFFEDWSSPIRYGNKVNLRQYFDDVISPGSRPDWLIYHLDINEFCGYSSLPGTTLPEIDDFITNYWNQYRLIDSIHVASPNTKIAICFSPMPNAREGTFQITFAGNPVLSNRWRWQKIISRLLFKNMERYGNREAENIFLLPEQLDLDDFADYEPADAIHPDPPDQNINTHCGYMEIAKSMYAWIRWAEFHPGSSAPTLYTYYHDADGDGYGNPGQTQMAINPPAGYTNQGGDCDDTKASVHPNATEICSNNIDDDCDGSIDEDLTVPLAGCKNNVQLPLNATGAATLTTAQVNQGSFDACSTVTMSLSRSQFSCSDLGQNTVTLNVQDASGNTNFCQTKVQVIDNLAPIVQCPNTSLDLGASGQVTATLTQLGLQATNNCGPVTWQTTASLLFTCQQANTTVALPLVAKDNAGNTATCTLQLLITNTADTDADGVKNCLDACPNDPATSTLLQFFRDVDLDGFGSGAPILACTAAPGMVSNHLDCNDNNPNIHPGAVELCTNQVDDNCNGTINEDLTAPLAVCKSAVQLPLNASGLATLAITQVNQGSSDACSSVTMSLSRSQFSCADLGQNTVTLQVQDAAGNSSTCTTTVQVVDVIAPVIHCPNLSLDLGPTGQIEVSPDDLGLQATDNCGPTSWHTTAALYFTCQQANTTVSLPFTAQDNAGNTTTCTLQILLTNTADTDGDGVNNCLDACPNDSSTTTFFQFFPDADGDGFGSSSSDAIFACARPAGTSTNSLDCDDNNPNIHPGALEICTNNVDDDCDGGVDEDLTAPLAICQTAIQLPLDSSGAAILSTNQVNQGSSDACSVPTLSLSQTAFSCAELGPHLVRLIVEDASGNTSFCETTVQVMDTLAPVIQCPDLSLDLGPEGELIVALSQLNLQASDNCSPTTWKTSAELHFTCFQANSTVAIPLFAQDSSGNTATCTLQLFLTDTTDTDADGLSNCLDACPNDAATTTLLQFFPDTDQDGFGSGAPVLACVPPPGTSTNDLDCDDTNPNIHPGALEIQDSLDNNCNGEIDEGLVGTDNLPGQHSRIKLFPNPANDQLWVAYPNDYQPVIIWIMEPTGRVVRMVEVQGSSPGQLEIELSGLAAGVYWVRVKMEGGREEVGRFLKI